MKDITEELASAFTVLKKGGIILYPTDTVWGIGCDATNADAIDRIYALKKREQEKAMICLVSDFKMLNQYVEEVPEVAYDILKYTVKPTTVVYEKPIRVAENLVSADNTLGIRVTKDEFCQRLIRKLKHPLVSTSANISGEPTPNCFREISPEVIRGVDYVVELQQALKTPTPSSIIKIGNDGTVEIIRK